MQKHEWREYLDRVMDRGKPSDFKAFLDEIKEKPEIDPEMWAAIYPAVLTVEIGETMLAAATQLLPEEAEDALNEITRALQRLDFKKDLRRLPRRERQWHERVVQLIRRDVLPGSEALAAAFRHYIRGDYDLQQDPNLLIKEANRLGWRNRRRALELVGQAGALALRGKPLWNRWPGEVTQRLEPWVFILWTFVDSLQQNPDAYPLEEVEEERARWPARMVALEKKPEPKEKEIPVRKATWEYGAALFDDLEPFFGGRKGITPQRLEELPRPREDYVSLLLSNVEQRNAWDLDDWDVQSLLGNMILLLGSFRVEEAVDALIGVVAEGPPEEDVLTQAAVVALGQIGEPSFGAVEDFIRYSDNQVAKESLAEVLAGWEGLGRPHGVIQDTWGRPLLVEFDEDDNPLCPHCGEPMAPIEEGWEAHEFEEKPEPRRVPKVGRNDPCPCGSGKKY
ncbi:MAG TPA: DUF2150 family protein, partial [Anaerolineae bacterium]|nr:DUF2150 family protein [Anaerolineae bacterium]